RLREKAEKKETATVKRDQTPDITEKKETPADKTDRPPAKWKQPPVAKSLDDGKKPIIVFGDAPPLDAEPIGSIKIKTRGRRGKKPPPIQPPKAEANSDAAASADAAPPKTIFTPLVLAGAIGGGGALVLGLIITLVCLLLVSGRGKSVAQTDKAKEKKVAPITTPAPVAPDEANPETPALEKNPETNPVIESGEVAATAS